MPFVLLLLSCVVLTLEVLETKIFAYCLANSLMFVVIGLALLGFGAGGTVLALRKQLGDPKPTVRAALLATSVLIIAAHAYFAQVSEQVRFGVEFATISSLVLLASPYFTSGMAMAAILGAPNANLSRLYGMNLVGSALGCCSLFVLLGPFTAPQVLVLCATVMGLLGAWLCRHRLAAGTLVLVVGAGLFVFAEDVFPYRPEPADSRGQLALLEQSVAEINDAEVEEVTQSAKLTEKFDRWDPTARVQVHDLTIESSEPTIQKTLNSLPAMWFTQDSSYGSPLLGDGPGRAAMHERTYFGAGYFRGQTEMDVLVIGLGGAPDVQTALHFDARSITGVDINQTTVGMVAGPFADFLGDPYGDPRVRIVIRDGRSFARTDDQLYDLIQLSGVDTKSVMSAGALAINESYLYTREGFEEYVARLKPDGLLCIIYAGDDYMHRLAISAMAALEKEGANEPHRHIALLRHNVWVIVMVKKTPFSAEECGQLDDWLASCKQENGETGAFLSVYELLDPGLNLRKAPEAFFIPDGRPTDSEVMQAARDGELDDYIAGYPLDLSPAPDSRPYFFALARNETVWSNTPRYFLELFTLAKIMAVLALVLIALPLVVFKARGIQIGRNLPFTVYFAALGAGFILAEIGLIQRYVLFLGHQGYAFPVVIGGLLVTAGIGSLWSERFQLAPHRLIVTVVAVVAGVIACHQLLLDFLFGLTADLPFEMRVLVAGAALVPLGVPLGMLFPTGLALVRRTSPLFIPWAFGINGVFSVLGTTIAVPGAMLYGFPSMAGLAAGVYVLAAVVTFHAARRVAT